jgi:flagellar secretion chaperone FliS
MNNPASTYRLHSVQGASPLGRVVMLYDAALARMHSAILAIEAGNIAQRGTHLNRLLDIVAELEGTLNFELGGKVAQTLKTFYIYVRTTVLQASIQNSAARLRALVTHWTTVRDAWQQTERSLQSETMDSLAALPRGVGAAPAEVQSLNFKA